MIPQELMKKVRQLEIRTRRSVSEVFAGEYSSAFRGRGMEFSEVREYQPGDDVRSIDWNVTARMGGPYIKRFVEERELTIVLAVDLSGSGTFGSVHRSKNETAAELCAVLAFAAMQKHDRVGLVIFTDHVELTIPPRKGLKHALRLIRELLNFEPAAGARGVRVGTDIAQAARTLNQGLKRRAVVFLVSDFLTDHGAPDSRSPLGPDVETALRLLARRHDVIAARIADPRERELPRAGLMQLEDAETGRRIIVDTSSSAVRSRFRALMRRRAEAVREQLRRVGIDSFEATTSDESYVHSLVELFRRRERRR